MEITIKTLTPLWTGGIETGKMDRIHETSLIGSLRWWYEAIVRGLGGWACDPTSEQRCPDKEGKRCGVCELFGCTGWKRRFSLAVIKDDTKPIWSSAESFNIRPPERSRGWFVPAGYMGNFTLHLTGQSTTLQKLLALFQFLESWGHLGSRPQLGYGRFQIEQVKDNPGNFSWSIYPNPQPQNAPSLPDLRTFTFFKLQFQPTQNDWWREVAGTRSLPLNLSRQLASQFQLFPTTPALKNYLRYGLSWPADLAHWFFGTRQGQQIQRSKMALSWAYQQADQWQINGWLYIPQDRIGQRQTAIIFRTFQPIFQQPQNWLRGMGLESSYRYPAHIQLSPTPSLQNTHSHQQIADFLNHSPKDVTHD